MDDWQDSFSSNRHLHNRVDRSRKGHSAKKNKVFNARNTFGTYDVELAAAARLNGHHGNFEAAFEIYRFNNDQDALFGALKIPGVLDGTTILTGSRKTLGKVTSNLEAEAESEESSTEAEATIVQGLGNEDGPDEEGDPAIERFEKNAFRNPKFWLRWNGIVVDCDKQQLHHIDSGYIIFAGNDCKRFDGTISCELLGWKNVKIRGFRRTAQSERDVEFLWPALASEAHEKIR